METKQTDIIKTSVTSPCGTFIGERRGQVRYFRGIKYAHAGRWEYPALIERYDGEYDATRFGASCYQMRAFEEDAVCNPFYHREFREGASYEYGEDCQFLNIWTPENAEKLPVVLYIHGGSFTGGCAHENMICGDGLCSRGCIFVSFNYRLGPYGFASHPDLTDKDGACGNYGLFDQLCAIKWVRRNIEAFGGDPERITLIGQSAGAMSVQEHIFSPTSEGMFKGAVMMSGAGALRSVVAPKMPEQTREFWDVICRLAGAENMAALRETDPKTLYYAWLQAQKEVKGATLCTAPVIDGKLIVRSPAETVKLGLQKNLPCIVGVTRNDMAPAMLYFFANTWMRSQKKAGMAPCWGYYFDRPLPGDDFGAWHACDMLYMYETLNTNYRPFAEADYAISRKMGDMLAAFAKTGDPNCPSLPKWKTGPGRVMNFAPECRMGRWNLPKLLKYTIKNKGPM